MTCSCTLRNGRLATKGQAAARIRVRRGLCRHRSAVSPPDAAALEPCGNKAGYSYAGFQSANRGHGIRATLVSLGNPKVRNGHVAAWVGVGGSGLGPNGTNQWLQVGLNAFQGTGSNLYYEVTTGGAPPRYHEIAANVSPRLRHRVAVLEIGDATELVARLAERQARLTRRSTCRAAAAASSRSRPRRPGTPARLSATASTTGSTGSELPRRAVAAGTASCRRTASRTATTA